MKATSSYYYSTSRPNTSASTGSGKGDGRRRRSDTGTSNTTTPDTRRRRSSDMSTRSSRSSRTPQGSSTLTPTSFATKRYRNPPPLHSKAQRRVEERERELMGVEDYKSRKVELVVREKRAREVREVNEKERIKLLKEGWGAGETGGGGSSNSSCSNGGSSENGLGMVCSHDFQVEDQRFMAGLWVVQGAKGAARKESSWVMKTSEQMFVERRRAYLEVRGREMGGRWTGGSTNQSPLVLVTIHYLLLLLLQLLLLFRP